jgi:hypothetical protein
LLEASEDSSIGVREAAVSAQNHGLNIIAHLHLTSHVLRANSASEVKAIYWIPAVSSSFLYLKPNDTELACLKYFG